MSDTSPIANLIVVNYSHLLPQLFGTVIVPAAVYQELLANGTNHPVTQTVQTVDWLEVRSVRDQQQVEILERDYNLDPREANAIVGIAECNYESIQSPFPLEDGLRERFSSCVGD